MEAHINGIKISYSQCGSGAPLLLLHAFPLGQSMWAPQISALSNQCRVITLDMRGFGNSDVPDGPYSMEQMAEDVNALIDCLGIDRVILGGLSMGGYVALAFYRKRGSRVSALILADTRARRDEAEVRENRYKMAQLLLDKGAAAISEQMISRLLSEKTRQSNHRLVEQARNLIESNSPKGLAAALLGMAERQDSTDLLSRISCPTLLLVGEQDSISTVAEMRSMKEQMPMSRLVVIPDAGHLSNWEQPAAFNQAVREFLRELPLVASKS